MAQTNTLVFAVATAVALLGAQSINGAAVASKSRFTCPDVQPMKGLNTTEFVKATWYIQQQQVTEYLPPDENYCVAQTLVLGNATVPFFSGPVISVFNYATIDEVNGKPANTKNGQILCARQATPGDPARIINAPCFLPNSLAGDYWVIGAGPAADNYEWAIISAGAPTVEYSDGCTTKTTGVNGAGLWLFTREAVPGPLLVQEMRMILSNMSYTLQLLANVTQAGCNYDGAYIISP